MQANQFYNNILRDVATDLTDAFDQNFERKAFFTEKWKQARLNRTGFKMARTGTLRRSIQHSIGPEGVRWKSSEPYASIHNTGGVIKVTPKMKKFFWAKYLEASGKKSSGRSETVLKKDGTADRRYKIKSPPSEANSLDAKFYKNMALMKVGAEIKMPRRQFIGDHPEVKQIIQECMEDNLRELDHFIQNQLRQR